MRISESVLSLAYQQNSYYFGKQQYTLDDQLGGSD